MSSRFYDIDPSLENCWRAVVLLGRNEASYKFALAKALLELAEKDCHNAELALQRRDAVRDVPR